MVREGAHHPITPDETIPGGVMTARRTLFAMLPLAAALSCDSLGTSFAVTPGGGGGPGGGAPPAGTFQASSSGALTENFGGIALFAPADSLGRPFIIQLVGDSVGDIATLVQLTFVGTETPRAVTYEIVTSPLSNQFGSIIVRRQGTSVVGNFLQGTGTVTLTTSTANSVAGRFTVTTTGFLTQDGVSNNTAVITVTGRFNAVPGVRR